MASSVQTLSLVHPRATQDRRYSADYLARLGGRLIGATLYPVALPGTAIADEKQTWVLRDASHAPRAIAQVSSPVSPNMVGRGVERAASIRAAIAPAAAEAVLCPIATGTVENASFAIWPFCQPVEEVGPRWLMRRVLARPLLDWLRELVEQTAQPADEIACERIGRDLCRMATHPSLGVRARLAARAALKRLDGGTWRPMQVAMHGDLHGGNVLIDAGNAIDRASLAPEQRFVVIDWCGASLSGYPLFDLIRIADSLRMPTTLLAVEISEHCKLLGGTIDDAVAHTATSIADLGSHLEYFPVERYAEMAERVFQRLDAALPHGGVLS